MKISELGDLLGLDHQGEEVEIRGVAPMESATSDDLSFISEAKWLSRDNQAGALLILADLADSHSAQLQQLGKPVLLSQAPALDAGRAGLLLGASELTVSGIHPGAFVDETAKLGPNVSVGPGAVLGAEVQVGADTVIHAGAVIHARCIIGERCIIHSNGVVGADGFGYEFVDGRHQRIPHLGIVRIGNDVEVGACTTIDRARFGETRIGHGVKIDNQVQIAHNVEVGDHSVIVSQAGVSGSCRIGPGVILAGQAGVVPHVTIGAGARIGAATGVAKDVPAGETWSGWWGRDHRSNMTAILALHKLPAFMKTVKAFMKQHGG
ncbi:MAG: UDP-3-O-(3-hydroxymyristoyl)glucosamine N-acyltransferase [Magnetococcales bacterium]|nr:UDP-3-O-(3-hydroxymyristoyl)glucosamine N-acyltransferase [Magnetococcales bacterium]